MEPKHLYMLKLLRNIIFLCYGSKQNFPCMFCITLTFVFVERIIVYGLKLTARFVATFYYFLLKLLDSSIKMFLVKISIEDIQFLSCGSEYNFMTVIDSLAFCLMKSTDLTRPFKLSWQVLYKFRLFRKLIFY